MFIRGRVEKFFKLTFFLNVSIHNCQLVHFRNEKNIFIFITAYLRNIEIFKSSYMFVIIFWSKNVLANELYWGK